MRRSSENVGSGDLKTETHIGQTRSDHDNPHDFDGRHREAREPRFILKRKTNQQYAGLHNVLGKLVENELLDVVEHATALLDSVEN